jgi:hypothetical protein
MASVITGGTVSVEDCKKHEGYPDPQFAPTRKVRVELIFTVPEGQDGKPYLDATAAEADVKVAELLGSPPRAKTTKPVSTSATPEPGSKAALEAELVAKGASAADLGHAPQTAAPGPRRPGRPAKTTPEAAQAPAATPAAPVADPDELVVSEEPAATVVADDDLGDLTGEAKVEPISDLELNNAVAKRNAVIKSGIAIRKLVQTFNPDPAKLPNIVLAQIPQERRADFLKKLEVLTAE